VSGGAIVEALDREGLLCPLEGGLVRVPHLVRGRLVAPPAIGADEARAALAAAGPGATYARVAAREGRAGAQVLRETLVDRATMRARADGVSGFWPSLKPRAVTEASVDSVIAG